ncbi:uncharacterized protein BDR25DRAFT_115229 [Lindgomyces ingoldianus]|uniref:Uncharacterized protein n=1 Tax=Lindgomyces ingoldianus TaxID=673940 RepID=A0ACB6Q9B3_9PLEO|nr:uncharacterized protein BDR25DRAFT_115229 [Lindgomyces ingoldianus]KAF2463120.1 hypothetical protein BDR25DRAFT_115229 [Lindgomyces ingoldianus]
MNSKLAFGEDIDLLLRLATVLQSKILLCISAAAGVFFILALIPLLLLKRNQKKLGNKTALKKKDLWKKCLMVCVWSSVGLAVAAAVGIGQSAAAMQQITTPEHQSLV